MAARGSSTGRRTTSRSGRTYCTTTRSRATICTATAPNGIFGRLLSIYGPISASSPREWTREGKEPSDETPAVATMTSASIRKEHQYSLNRGPCGRSLLHGNLDKQRALSHTLRLSDVVPLTSHEHGEGRHRRCHVQP